MIKIILALFQKMYVPIKIQSGHLNRQREKSCGENKIQKKCSYKKMLELKGQHLLDTLNMTLVFKISLDSLLLRDRRELYIRKLFLIGICINNFS